MKIAIIGAGMVGSCATFLLAKELNDGEIVLYDKDVKKAKAEALDINQGLICEGRAIVVGGDEEVIKESDIVVVTAGVKQKIGEKREELKDRNKKVLEEIGDKIKKYAPNALVVVATNPLDEMVDVMKEKLGEKKVLGTGTELDSYRFRYYLGKFFGVSPKSVRADVLGYHNENAKFMWDSVYIGGMKSDEFLELNKMVMSEEQKKEIENEVINSAFYIIEGKGATYWGIAVVIANIVKAIIGNEGVILNVSLGTKEALGASPKKICKNGWC